MFYGYIETDTGETLRMIDSVGKFRGKAALAFLVMVSNFRLYTDDKYHILQDVVTWFNEFDQNMSMPAEQALLPLDNCYYVGEWGSFMSGEHEFFVKRTGVDVSAWEFEEGLGSIDEKWTLLGDVIKSNGWLVEQFHTQDLRLMDWYNKTETTLEFEIMQRNLLLLKERHCKAVRIKFIM